MARALRALALTLAATYTVVASVPCALNAGDVASAIGSATQNHARAETADAHAGHEPASNARGAAHTGHPTHETRAQGTHEHGTDHGAHAAEATPPARATALAYAPPCPCGCGDRPDAATTWNAKLAPAVATSQLALEPPPAAGHPDEIALRLARAHPDDLDPVPI